MVVNTVKSSTPTQEPEPTEQPKSIFVPIVKANNEEQTVTGVVLQPEITDAQGDIIGADVIKKAAHNFLAKYNMAVKKATKLGLQHKFFDKNFELLESWIAPHGVVINNVPVKQGSWIITVRVKDSTIWKKVKDGAIKGFSIGGKAKVKAVQPQIT